MKSREEKVSPEILRSLLDHDAETGRIFWKPRGRECFNGPRTFKAWNKRFAGKEAFVTEQGGYFSGVVNYIRFRHTVSVGLSTTVIGQRWPSTTSTATQKIIAYRT